MTAPHSVTSRLRGAWRLALAGPASLVGVAVIVFSILSFASPAPAAVPANWTVSVSTKPADIEAGNVIFDEHCASCHGVGGVGGSAPELLNVGPAAVDFFVSTGRMPLNSPKAEPLTHHPYFNPKQISELDAYVNAVDLANGTPGPGIPNVAAACRAQSVDCPTLSEGNQLFLMNCAQCHDASGAGGMLSHGYVIPSLRQATARQIAEAIRIGPRPMPNFGPGQLTDQQVSAIADYVAYISTGPDRGGLGIAHFGPVPEGFVGIVFGLGLLLVVSRLIGNRG
ncbi:MAG TPA: c-type cytochrome [Acidimicrobiales bacterium]|nr:c-type cytochrome [Acidimicrobiales bacterium]